MSISNSFYNIYQESNQTGTTPDYKYSPLSNLTRCKGCNKNLTSNNPSTRYQIQKLIQNTVRVPSSIYTMNLGALNVYQKPDPSYQVVNLGDTSYIASPGVNWNQMSDRAKPHKQVVKSGNGLTGNSLKRTITRLRPGALSPGGTGVDIKHNSYDRYLARIKGKAPLRRQRIPDTFLLPYIPFNRADPVYGGKLFKTSIVNNCNCPIDIDNNNNSNTIIYQGSVIDEIANVRYTFNVGDIVLTKKSYLFTNELFKAEIISISNDKYVGIRFLDDNIEEIVLIKNLTVYIPLKTSCIDPCLPMLPTNLNFRYVKDQLIVGCVLFNYLENGKITSTITQ
jgi:hypothetical protein